MRLTSTAAMLLLVACGGGLTPMPPSPAPIRTAPTPDALAAGAPSSPVLPPVPLVTGTLAPRVVYPAPNALIQSRDSNFIFGSVGDGRASLTINGAAVHVGPNGAYLAWLPVPPQDAPSYELIAAFGPDTARLSYPIRLLPVPVAADSVSADSAQVDTIRADTVASGDSAKRLTADSVRRLTVDSAVAYVALGGTPDSAAADTDRVIIARPVPRGTYKWFLLPGTVLRQTGRDGDFVRVRLDAALDVWVAAADATVLPLGTTDPVRVAGNARVVPGADYIDLVLPIGSRPAYAVEESNNDLVLTLYGVRATTDIIGYRQNDPMLRTVEWVQETNDRARFTVHLRERPFGYLVMWDNGALVLRVRRPPAIDVQNPLRGLTIAVDPGHPPIGATGPTGLWEPQATLWVGERLAAMLRARGANVVMTRTTMDPVALGDRPTMARRANAQLLVSIHLNALPDGINPFRAQGSGTYFFQAQAEPLARAVQRGLVARMQLPNLGVYYDNLALARPTWMPSILCEGAFLMMPDQEAGLRTPQFQEAYARGIADGIEEYFRDLPSQR
jgi:N-acetylmuramoyl-L-alanine amidase